MMARKITLKVDRHAEERQQRKGERVGEQRVVVQAQVDRWRERQDLVGEERKAAVRDDLVAEDPEVPDVDARVAARPGRSTPSPAGPAAANERSGR